MTQFFCKNKQIQENMDNPEKQQMLKIVGKPEAFRGKQ
jgi:hypothetical protein